MIRISYIKLNTSTSMKGYNGAVRYGLGIWIKADLNVIE